MALIILFTNLTQTLFQKWSIEREREREKLHNIISESYSKPS